MKILDVQASVHDGFAVNPEVIYHISVQCCNEVRLRIVRILFLRNVFREQARSRSQGLFAVATEEAQRHRDRGLRGRY